MIVQTNGICVDEGCEISFDASSLYIALGMTALDSVLVCLFSYRLYSIIHQLEKQETTNVCMAAEWKQFKFQLLCMSVVLISCMMDEVLHYMYIDSPYDMTPVYVLDVLVISFANFASLRGM